MYSVFVALLALACANAFHLSDNSNGLKKKPDFCQDYDCPQFDLESKTDDYEVRVYHPTKYAHVKVDGWLYASTISSGFMPLLKYITGNNADSRKMNMTVPVVVKFDNLDGFKVSADVHFYMPDSYGKLPAPSDSRVKIATFPKLKAYVRTFSGYVMSTFQVKRQRNKLFSDLNKSGLKYDKDTVFLASYNKPTKIRERHNEVWVLAA